MKVSKEIKEKALTLGRKHKASLVFVNEMGEVFTEEQYARASVGGDKGKYAKIEVAASDAYDEVDETLKGRKSKSSKKEADQGKNKDSGIDEITEGDQDSKGNGTPGSSKTGEEEE